MLVEINLLAQEQKRTIFVYITTAVVVLAVLIAGIAGYVFYESKAQTLENIETEVQFTVALREIEEQKLAAGESIDSYAVLSEKIDWIKSQRISFVFLLNHLVSILPERGFFMNYQYSDQGAVSINVQFDTPREAANYLYELNELPYITEATLQNLTTHEVNDEGRDERFQYLPRYIANYSLTIDRDIVKSEEKKGE
jgi:type IV pilus assembly protein PilN